MKNSPMHSVLVADDHTILRDGIRTLISKMKNLKVVGEASTGKETVAKYDALKPDLLILDISMPDKNGMDVAKEILESFPDASIIILSMYDDEDYINRCLEMGVKGYVVKNESGTELKAAIESVFENKNYFSTQVQKVIFRKYTQHVNKNKRRESLIKLTQREIDIIRLIAEGLTSQEMADKLFISPRTVETHRANLLKKVGVKNAMELVKKVQELKLLE